MSETKLKIGELHHAVFAGNSTITVVRPAGTSKVVKDGAETTVDRPESRYTFKITRAKGDEDSRPWFVKVMFGPNNEADFVFLGIVFTSEDGLVFRSSPKSPVKATDARFVAFNWLVEHLAEIARLELKSFEHKLTGELFAPADLGDELAGPVGELGKVEVWASNACCRCGRKLTTPASRKLTVPSSIKAWLGPECQKLYAGA
jgi:hypothetical protein